MTNEAKDQVRAYRLVEEIWIDAPRNQVFRALTDPTEIVEWWTVEGAYRTTDAEIELRPGGRYRFTGTSERTGTFEVKGEYREVDSPRRLAYTWNPAWDDGARGSVVAITLQEEDGGTRLRVEHTGFATEAARDDHVTGWPPVLEGLKSRAESAG